MSSCIFCKIVAGEIPCLKVYEDERLLAFLDIQPVNLGHTLIIPKEHFENFLVTPDEVVAAIAKAVKPVAQAAMAVTGAPGFNIGVNTGTVAGQIVMHTHLHVMPRLDGDGLTHWPKKAVDDEEMKETAAAMRAQLNH